MTTIVEGKLAFDFPDDWRATKYDNWTFYQKQFQKVCNGTKAMDIVAVHVSACLWMIEVKDYRVEPRQKSIGLAEEMALKVRDTLAGLAAARVRANDEDEKRLANLGLRCPEIKVVLHLEQPIKATRLHPVEDVSKLIQKLKQFLKAIDAHPSVTMLSDGNRFGWHVREV